MRTHGRVRIVKCAVRAFRINLELDLPDGGLNMYAVVSTPTDDDMKKVKDPTLKYRYKP